MLRRLTSCLTVISLLVVSLAPLASTASAAPAQGRGQQRRQSKVAPELAGAAAASGASVRVIVQTKGRPTASHDQAIKSKRGAGGAGSFSPARAFPSAVVSRTLPSRRERGLRAPPSH